MRRKNRITSLLTAAVCTVSMLSVMPHVLVSASIAVQNDFEVTYEGWHGSDMDVEVQAREGIGFDDSRGMLVFARTDASQGAQAEKGYYLSPDVTYTYSVRVYSETADTFRFVLTTKDIDTAEDNVVTLDTQTAPGGQWITLSGTYKAPKNHGEFQLNITTDSVKDFRFDDLKITTDEPDTLTASAAEQGIKDEIVNFGIRSGNILNGGTISDNGIKTRLLKDCNAIECENETKPDATLSQSGSSNTDIKVRTNSFAAIADWCDKNGLAFRGHTMVWHSQTPEWFFKDNFQNGGNWVSSSVMDQRMESYIKNMFGAFKSQYPTLNLYAYDVCNECISDDGSKTANNGDGRRNPGMPTQQDAKSPWVQVYGSNAFIEKAFTFAAKYRPEGCKLFYNDYNEYWDHKRDCIIRTCKPLLQKGVLDGIGMQSHVDAQANTFSGTNNYLKAMDMYLSNGFEVQITELDVSVKEGGDASSQATKYAAILSHAIENNVNNPNGPHVTLFQVWGPDDGHTWLGSGTYPLLYDSNGNAKSAYTAVTSIVPKSEWGDGTKFAGGMEFKEPELDADGYWFHYTFENGTEDFSGRSGGETLSSSGSAAYAGSKSLSVTGRTAAWHGASHALSSRVFKAGESYSFSGCVQLASGSASETVHFTMQYKIGDETYYEKIKSTDAVKGEWVQLANTNFKIPENATDMYIYFECDGADASYYVDEVIGAPVGTVIAGPGEGKKVLLGDVSCDGKLNAADLTLMKRALMANGNFDNNIAKINADVDQNGKAELKDAVLLFQFLLREIDEFPVAEVEVDFSEMEKVFQSITPGTSLKKDNENNPLTTQRFGADPGWMVYKDRLYIYTTNDAYEYASNGKLQINTYNSGTINCVSSADLVNWTDHGAIPVADRNGRTTNGAAKWAGAAWAPDACWKTINGKDKFFLYFANSAGGIGVLTADSPTGPWSDPLGHAMITGSTPNCSDVVWMFDPGVYYDPQTNEGYIAFGGGRANNVAAATPGTGRIAKLGDDMTSLSGNPVKMQTPYLFEDSSIIKIGDTWYYSYCSNWNVPGGTNINGVSFGNADILYMTSKDPLKCAWGTSDLKGNVFKNTATQRIDNGGNNHHSIIYFKGEYYVAYHSRQYALRTGQTFIDGGDINNRSKDSNDGNYRSTQINKATFNPSNGSITCNGNMTGCEQLETLNPYVTQQAETMANQSGIQVKGVGDTVVNEISKGDWIKVKGVNFDEGCRKITVKASSQNGAVIKVSTGSATGTAFAYVQVPAGSSNKEITVSCKNITGVNDIVFEFSGEMEFDSWKFS